MLRVLFVLADAHDILSWSETILYEKQKNDVSSENWNRHISRSRFMRITGRIVAFRVTYVFREIPVEFEKVKSLN